LKKVELYASPSLYMLKALVEKIELRFDRKNPSPLEALYQEYETDFPNAADPFRYERIQTRFNFSHQPSRQKKDAAQRFINVIKSIANIHPINKVIRLKT
jgi:hypothetical protein